jgi:hypothetical protein
MPATAALAPTPAIPRKRSSAALRDGQDLKFPHTKSAISKKTYMQLCKFAWKNP